MTFAPAQPDTVWTSRLPHARPPFETTARPHERVLMSHVDEAAAGWRRRARLVTAPHVRLRHLARSDQRLLAHMAGIRVAGEEGWQAVQRALEDGDAGAVAVLAWIAFVDGRVERMRSTLPLLLADPAFTRAGTGALSSLAPARLHESLQRLADSPHPAHRWVALDVQAAQRRDPGPGLARALSDDDAALRARALQALGELGQPDRMPQVMEGLEDATLAGRRAACESAFILGSPREALRAFDRVLQDAASLTPAERRPLLESGIRALPPEAARDVVRQLAAQAGTAREAVIAAGAHGDPVAVPWLIDRMADPGLARVAGEAVALITGADLELQIFKRAGPYEEEEGGAPPHPEDQDLPPPDASGFHVWWREHGAEFGAGHRYIAGQPLTAAGCLSVLRDGTQRQRQAAAQALSRLRPGTPLFAVRAFAFRQRKELGL